MYNNLIDQLNILIDNKSNTAANLYPALKQDISQIMPLITQFKAINKDSYATPDQEFVKFTLTDINPLMQTYASLYLTISNDFDKIPPSNQDSIKRGAGNIIAAFTEINDIITQTPRATATTVAASPIPAITMPSITANSIASDKYASYAGLDKVTDATQASSKSLTDITKTQTAIAASHDISNKHSATMDSHLTAAQTATSLLSSTLNQIVNILQRPTQIGRKGITGIQGEPGLKGDVGLNGNNGDEGQIGDSITGPDGIMGIKGEKGEQGPKGQTRPTKF